MNGANFMLWICSREILTLLDRAGPLSHLKEMTICILPNMSLQLGIPSTSFCLENGFSTLGCQPVYL